MISSRPGKRVHENITDSRVKEVARATSFYPLNAVSSEYFRIELLAAISVVAQKCVKDSRGSLFVRVEDP